MVQSEERRSSRAENQERGRLTGSLHPLKAVSAGWNWRWRASHHARLVALR